MTMGPGDAMNQLTPREQEVWQLLSKRLTNQEISQLLGIRVRTTEHHVAQVMAKLGVTNRRQVAPVGVDGSRGKMRRIWREAPDAWRCPDCGQDMRPMARREVAAAFVPLTDTGVERT
jgi:DNA-binding CsgD family transcriptional regulator